MPILHYAPCQSIRGCPGNTGLPGIIHGCLYHTIPPARVSVDAQVTLDIQGSSMDAYTTLCPYQSIRGCPGNTGHPGIIHGWLYYTTPPPPARVSVDAQVTLDIRGSSMDGYTTLPPPPPPPPPARVSVDAQVILDIRGSSMDPYTTLYPLPEYLWIPK